MAQFIQYLYEYENGKRVRNLGFMKVEKQMDKSIIQIYSKQVDEVKGITFQKEDGRQYYATWEPEMPENTQPEMGRPAEQWNVPKSQEPENQGYISEEEGLQEDVRNSLRDGAMTEMNEAELAEEVSMYIPQSSRRFEKIQRQELSRLPRREWRLANNSFLLHGYHNYHHLLYIEDEGEIWIGVPGIYHEKEQMAANAFGFGKFQRLTDFEAELSEEEKNTDEDFGYWCRQVARS